MTDEQIIQKILKGVMKNDKMTLKTLWRMSNGVRDKAFEIIRKIAVHYGLTSDQIDDYHIDCALGELNGGVEIEWLK